MHFRALCISAIIGLLLTASWAQNNAPDLIVRLKHSKDISRIHKEYGTRTVRNVRGTPIYLIGSDDKESARLIQDLKNERLVEMVERNSGIRLQSATPGPILGQSMDMLLDGSDLTTFYGTYVLKAYATQPALNVVQASVAHGVSTGAGAAVAYIDTGVDVEHPALRPWLEEGVDLVNHTSVSEMDGLSQSMDLLLDQSMDLLLDKRFMFLLDQNMDSLLDDGAPRFPSALGHGTLVAGLIHVIAPEARLVPIKAFDAYGYTDLFTVVQGVYEAIELDVDVLNMSFSTFDHSDVFKSAVSEARSRGIAVVASVGNDGLDLQKVYPASFPGVHGVAATDFSDRLAAFSNYGSAVAIAAPGTGVVSTVPGGRYAAAWGTSFSAPIVSGAMALSASLRARGQSDSALVINSADSIDELNPGLQLGRGRVNALKALSRREE
jgi:subtilisin family serine protease